MTKAKVTTIGSSSGIILPKEILSKLKVGKGDTVTFIETPNGVEITAYDPEFDEEMTHARKVMGDYRNALKKLAK
ncbi:MAG: AbrB/MazE/SpoVT family DNA-binding domain-containing protein [Cyclobacteriaceae bacterium]